MCKTGFDNQLYIEKQSAEIQKRISDLGGKLYLEFGGKLFDDFHASRVLPGFAPDSKIQMLKALSDKAEILIAINAGDIVKNKIRGDLGITYDQDVLRLIDAFRGFGLFVSTVVITCYTPQPSVEAFHWLSTLWNSPIHLHTAVPSPQHSQPHGRDLTCLAHG